MEETKEEKKERITTLKVKKVGKQVHIVDIFYAGTRVEGFLERDGGGSIGL